MQDSLDAGMLYGGTVTLPSDLAERALELLQTTVFAFGRSRSAQYAACSLVGVPQVVPVYKRKSLLQTGGTLYAVLESDFVLVRNGVYVADNASVREALAARLGIKPELPPETLDYCQYRIISGFQEQWHLQKPQIPAVKAGSVYCFQTAGTEFERFQMESNGDAEPRCITLGEFQEEGFGKIRIYTAEEMKGRVVFEKCPPDMRKHDADDPDAVERLETALTVSAGLDALKKSVWLYYENLRKEYREHRREKGEWISTGTIDRLRLMLSESKTYEDFLRRIDAMKESNVHSQKTRSERDKALELARGLCGKDGVSAETMLTCSGERALLHMILSRPAAKERIEKHWRNAVSYLLDIAYYDKRKAG
jgi:CRISPR-associated protein Csx10